MKLYNHQQKLVDKAPERHLLAWEMRTGKTATALSLVNNIPGINTVLIVCPKQLLENWKRELSTWTSWPNISVTSVMSKEDFKKVAKDLQHYDAIIIDEAHHHAGATSQLQKETTKYVTNNSVRFRYLLTGTPYLSTAWNIYCLANLLGKDWKYHKFRQHFFYKINMGGRMIWLQRKGIEKEIGALVKSLGSTVSLSDCVDMPEQIFVKEFFELNKEQKKAIDTIEDFLPIVLTTKLHQVNGGTLKDCDGNVNQFKSDKIKRISELVKENKKLIIVCRYNAEIYMLKDIIEKKHKKTTYIINGSIKNRDEVIQSANNSKNCVVLVNAMCSEGYDLQSFNKMVFYSMDYSIKNYLQICARTRNLKKTNKCVYIHLLIKDTVDEAVYACIEGKKDFDAAIYSKSLNNQYE